MNKKLPKVALGAWAWGTGSAGGDQIFGHSLGESELKAVFDRAMELGLNLWDTATVYGMGASEKILGEFIKDINKDNVIISTKFTPQLATDSPNTMEETFKVNLKNLGVDYIDIYWIHNPADVKKWTEKIIPLAKSGKIGMLGLSNHSLEEIKLAESILAKEGLKVSAIQNHYSLLHRSSEDAGILDYCKKNGIIFFAYMVLEQGALSGKYTTKNPLPAGSARAVTYNPLLPEIEKLLPTLKEVADKHDASIAQIAVAWAIAKGTLPIIGVTSVAQVEDAAFISKINLSDDEIKKIEEVAKTLNIKTTREWEKDMK
ncbi:aldo/keto reductase [Fusobacterium simiae]|uniref:Aldo/keto reductase n=1 Tax=Fusobacterium simiae TaxID=855 RepID=A0ABT4DP57_FUSSI|nr:aldo/keto reductase [Fusobacterium simiae]MCY7009166.1 aldo/keto reductase [Fusobacterium simiae]